MYLTPEEFAEIEKAEKQQIQEMRHKNRTVTICILASVIILFAALFFVITMMLGTVQKPTLPVVVPAMQK